MQTDNPNLQGAEPLREEIAQGTAQQVKQAADQISQTQSHVADAAHGGHEPVQQSEKGLQKLKKKRKTEDGKKPSAENTDSVQADSDIKPETTTQGDAQEHAPLKNAATNKLDASQAATAPMAGSNGAVTYQDNINTGAGAGLSTTKSYLAANTHAGNVTGSDVGMVGSTRGVQLDSISKGEATPAVGLSGWAVAGLALAGIGAAAAGGGGGGGGGSSHGNSSTAPIPPAVTQTTVSGVVMAGPVLASAGLSVTAYGLDGRVLGTSLVNDKGEYSIVLPVGFSGPVRVGLIDGNGNASDYWDEASRGAKDVGARRC